MHYGHMLCETRATLCQKFAENLESILGLRSINSCSCLIPAQYSSEGEPGLVPNIPPGRLIHSHTTTQTGPLAAPSRKRFSGSTGFLVVGPNFRKVRVNDRDRGRSQTDARRVKEAVAEVHFPYSNTDSLMRSQI